MGGSEHLTFVVLLQRTQRNRAVHAARARDLERECRQRYESSLARVKRSFSVLARLAVEPDDPLSHPLGISTESGASR